MAAIYHQVWTGALAAAIYAAVARPEAIGVWWAPQTDRPRLRRLDERDAEFVEGL